MSYKFMGAVSFVIAGGIFAFLCMGKYGTGLGLYFNLLLCLADMWVGWRWINK